MARTEILTWDPKTGPNLDQLAQVVADLSGGTIHLAQADTGNPDKHAVVLSTEPLDVAKATAAYDANPDPQRAPRRADCFDYPAPARIKPCPKCGCCTERMCIQSLIELSPCADLAVPRADLFPGVEACPCAYRKPTPEVEPVEVAQVRKGIAR